MTSSTCTTQVAKPESPTKTIWINALWKNNPAFVQLLGLCPLLATTNGASTALGLGLSTLFVMVCSNVLIAAFKDYIPHEVRIPIFVVVIASLVTIIQMLINSYAYSLYLSLGIFLPLIVTNCIVIGRIEAFAYKNSVWHSFIDGLAMGTGMCFALVVLGIIREFAGQGTIFKNLDVIFGPSVKNWYLQIFHADNNFLLATLAPGAFIFLGILIAFKNFINTKYAERAKKVDQVQATANVQADAV